MPAFPRAELEEMVERWLQVNRDGEANRDWRHMADMFTEDATYGWNVGANDEFMAVGREEIREYALGYEMDGLGGWIYPYQRVLIDDAQGEILGLWKQIADATRPDGSHYEIAGLGGSWFRYAGDFKWSWQRDFFDVGNATATATTKARRTTARHLSRNSARDCNQISPMRYAPGARFRGTGEFRRSNPGPHVASRPGGKRHG